MATQYARLLRMHLKIDRIDAAKKIFEESIIPLCKGQKGFLGAYFLEQIIKFMPFFTSPPIREGFEVVVNE